MQARETNARRAEDRKRSVLVLAQRFLLEHNMPDSARALEREGGVPLKTFDAADNASLTHVLAEWEALHEERFGFRPKLTRRADDPPPGSSAAALAATKGKAGAKAGAERRAARIAAEREASSAPASWAQTSTRRHLLRCLRRRATSFRATSTYPPATPHSAGTPPTASLNPRAAPP